MENIQGSRESALPKSHTYDEAYMHIIISYDILAGRVAVTNNKREARGVAPAKPHEIGNYEIIVLGTLDLLCRLPQSCFEVVIYYVRTHSAHVRALSRFTMYLRAGTYNSLDIDVWMCRWRLLQPPP